MPDIDLEPHQWRLTGTKRVKPRKPMKQQPPIPAGREAYYRPIFSILAVLCAIWAGIVISVCNYWVPGQNPWWIALLSLGPGGLLFLLMVLNDD